MPFGVAVMGLACSVELGNGWQLPTTGGWPRDVRVGRNLRASVCFAGEGRVRHVATVPRLVAWGLWAFAGVNRPRDRVRDMSASPFPPPGFGRFWAGETVSGVGSYITLLVLPTPGVWRLHGTAQQ